MEVKVRAPYLDASSFTEKWFKHIESDDVWRLVWPDALLEGFLKG